MATETPEPERTPTPSPLRDDELEPVPRDTRFVVRLVLALLVGLLAAGWASPSELAVVEQLYRHDWALTRQLLKKASDLDLLRLEIPPAYGGLGLVTAVLPLLLSGAVDRARGAGQVRPEVADRNISVPGIRHSHACAR